MNHAGRSWTFLILASVVILAACGQGTTPPPPPNSVTKVTVSPATLELAVGDTGALTATVTANGTVDETVTWSSSDSGVASVDDDGQVTALAEGTATITATSNHDSTKKGTAQVTVTADGGPDGEPPLAWTIQFGDSGLSRGEAVAVDSQGYVYLAGITYGPLAGPSLGGFDIILRKHTPDGDEVWIRRLGGFDIDEALVVTVDQNDDVLVGGTTLSNLDGMTAGTWDAFLIKVTSEGDVEWTEQFGGPAMDRVNSILVESDGNIVVAGRWLVDDDMDGQIDHRGFVRRFEYPPVGPGVTPGTIFRTEYEVRGLAKDSDGNFIATGGQVVADHGEEIVILKLDPDLSEVWTRQFGSGEVPATPGGAREPVPATRRPMHLWEGLGDFEDAGVHVDVDVSGAIYVAGYVGASVDDSVRTGSSSFVMRLTSDGAEEWAVLFPAGLNTEPSGIAVDLGGNIVVVGNTLIRPNPGVEMFVRQLDPSGDVVWEDIFGTTGWDDIGRVAIDAEGSILVGGSTQGDLAGKGAAAWQDVFVRKYVP